MKNSWLLLPAIALLVCACQKKPIAPAAESVAPSSTPVQVAQATPVPVKEKEVPLPEEATPEQLGSTLRVRVAFGGMPPRDTIGALVHRDEIANKTLVQGKTRFVIALLESWDEARLRDSNTHLIVYRNKVNEQGNTMASSHPAHLVQFDAATHQALLTYTDNFEYSADAGFHLERSASLPVKFSILRTVGEAAGSTVMPPRPLPPGMPQMPQFTRVPRFAVQIGAFLGTGVKDTSIRFPASTEAAKADEALLAVAQPDRLLGFVSTSQESTAGLVPVAPAAVDIKTPVLKVAGIKFGQARGYLAEFDLAVETSPAGFTPSQASLRVLASPEISLEEAARPNAAGGFAPIETQMITSLRWDAAAGSWKGGISVPNVGQKTPFLCQLSWPLFAKNNSVLGYGQPFLVELEHRPGGVYPTVRGLGGEAAVGQAAPAPAPKAQVDADLKPLALGARVRNAFPIAGGREILFELEDAPFWRRFSFEKNDWLPLPPGDAGNMAFTGNLTSLFVLDRSAGEVRKYKMPDLEQLATAKLPPIGEYVSILTGAASDHAPVYVLTATDVMALTSDTLQRRDVPASTDPMNRPAPREFKRNSHFAITGDGLSFAANAEVFGNTLHYNSDAKGLRTSYFDQGDLFHGMMAMNGVSASFQVDDGIRSLLTSNPDPLRRASVPASQWRGAGRNLVASSPIVFRLQRAKAETIPPKPPQLACLGYFDTEPFAVIDVPELIDVRDFQGWNRESGIFFDPISRKLATLDTERKNLYVRTVPPVENRDQPVLLNWPDSWVKRGGKFEFKPLLLGGTKFTAEVAGQPGLAKVDDAAGTVEVPVSETTFESLLLLNLRVAGANGTQVTYPIPLYVEGPRLPFVARSATEVKGLNFRGAGTKSLGASSNEFRALRSTMHLFPDRILEVLGTVGGCAVLVTDAGRVDFFSLTSRTVVGSIPAPPDACYYSAAGALLEFDPAKNTLTRINVPDGARTAVLNLPPNVKLDAIGAGADPASPVTMGLSVQASASVTRIGDLTITEKSYLRTVAVVDGKTLQAAGWAQPATVAQILRQPEKPNPLGEVMMMITPSAGRPIVLPTSHDGRIVTFERYFAVITRGYSVVYPYASNDINDITRAYGRVGATGSISGLLAISVQGAVFRCGVKVGDSPMNGSLGGTPCGRYRLGRAADSSDDACLEIKLAENGRPLMLAARFDLFPTSGMTASDKGGRPVVMLGDEGPLVLISPSGKGLQLVDFNIPAVAKDLMPAEFHVISQPTPCVMEGGRLQYQLRVNNPAAVRTCRLQTPVPGAFISSQGLLTYTAPMRTPKTTPTNFSIEIVGTDGRSVLHEFPVYILPLPKGQGEVRSPAI